MKTNSFIPRFLFVAFTAVFAVYAYRVSTNDNVVLERLVTVLVVSLLTSASLVFWEWRYQRNLARQLVAIIFGLTGGLLATITICAILLLFLVPYNVLQTPAADTLDKALYIALWQLQFWLPLIISSCLYLGVTVVLQTRDDFRFLIPYVDFSQYGTQSGGFLVDSSALIDGRLLKLAATGIFVNSLIIPDYVLRELQKLADSADPLKRERGRNGLENAQKLREMTGIRVIVRNTLNPPGALVDECLLNDAKELSARVLTVDSNLCQVSSITGAAMVNLSEISRTIRPAANVGDCLPIVLVKKGNERGQAIGYLDDGTMVVVEQAESRIGSSACPVIITGNIQTNAGRMFFGRLQ